MSTLRFVAGYVLICMGGYIAFVNWLTPVLANRSGRNVSMVPIVGGVLLGGGIYLVTNSFWWSLTAVPLDFGTLGIFLFAIPYLIKEYFASKAKAKSPTSNDDIDV